MPTLLLPPRITDDCEALRIAAVATGWEIYAATGWRFPTDLTITDPVVYADPLFADVAAARFGLRLLDPPLDWLAHIPAGYLHRDVAFGTLGAARERRDFPRFVKPAEDKSFPARVYASGDELPGDDLLPADTPVLLSEPVSWELEVRCFVLQMQIVAHSPYLRHGELAQDTIGDWPLSDTERTEALAFAATVIADPSVSLPPAVVIDVGRIAGRGWAVIEANAAWGSGLYGCDPAAALTVVRRANVSPNCLAAEDQPWLRPQIVIEG